MMAAQPEGFVTEGFRSLEVRWIARGRLKAAVAGWFARFPAEVDAREDIYLVWPQLRGLSVKVRGAAALEVKVYRGSPGVLEVPGRARARMESWQKWSFPCGPVSQSRAGQPGWQAVRKTRRISRFRLAGGQSPAWVPELGGGPGCAVELTEIHTRGQAWWSVGFEASGPASALTSQLEATAALIFGQAPPAGSEFGLDDSRSDAEWLRRWVGGGADAGA